MTLLGIVGPTAAGKSPVALEVAARAGATIVSVDSTQVYRGMDIGTAKPTEAERTAVPHEMVDVVDPSVDFTVSDFQAMARSRLDRLDGPVVLCGGSGLHLRAVIDPMTFPPHHPALRADLEAAGTDPARDRLLELDPDAGGVVDLQNPRRVVRALEIALLTGETPSDRAGTPEAADVAAYRPLYDVVLIGIDPGPEPLRARIEARTRAMIRAGLVDEVRSLLPVMGRNASQAVGYREIAAHLGGELTLEEAVAEIESATVALARRQRTWFGRDPRVDWAPADLDHPALVAYCLDRWRP